ncbi:ORF87 [Leucania separata nucleopolyhedrovirus]|uniref:ORF87 n=1 Tax=Leucania separata nucleopolyhedrovirus TaxID=1307956 RepID=Q0IL32_NPVLS|nr:ORF87 [Leucania separata nucleopolyhedrovirus]AAR28851.1 ORF87 [Leucania separata nucleopolyhedrovirus]
MKYPNMFVQFCAMTSKMAKVAFCNMELTTYLKELAYEDTLREQLVIVFKLFLQRKIDVESVKEVCESVGMELTDYQADYLRNRVYENDQLISIIENFIEHQSLRPDEINYVSEFLVHEINDISNYNQAKINKKKYSSSSS